MKNMKILFVNERPFNHLIGGIERVTDNLTRELIKRGYEVYYLCGKVVEGDRCFLEYNIPVELYVLPEDGLFSNETNIEYYKNLLEDKKIDIVINQRGLSGLFNEILPITSTNLISVIHSIPDADIIAHNKGLLDLTVPPFVIIKKTIKRVLFPIIRAYWKKKDFLETRKKYNELALYSNAIVTLSKKCVDTMANFITIPNEAKIVSIPNPNSFRSSINYDKKEKVILYVGRLSKDDKNPMRLLYIWNRLYKKYQNWQLKIVGEGPEKNNMEKYVKEQQLKNVFFEGRQSDVAKYYREASIVCLTSDFEGWGMTLTEGMQYGCIPFTFNNYGAAFEIIDDGLNGCLIPAYNLKKYASRLSELMSDENKRVEMSKAAMEKVKYFDVENVADQWENLFRSL